MNADELGLNETTRKIIGCAHAVSNSLGCGFLEKVYENALVHELKKFGLEVSQQQPIKVVYDNVVVGEYIADLIVNNLVLIELKAISKIDNVHKAQCLNYLKATGLPICLLLNFGQPKVEVKRIIL